MTDSKLIKYLEKINSKEDQAPTGPRIRKPLIISDSKGRYLREHIQSPVENQIIWQYKGGRTTYEGYNWLLQNIDHQIGQHGNIHFYIWLATCDLTSYNSPYIYLACENSDGTRHIVDTYHQIIETVNHYPHCSVTFLETPVYSIYEHNKYKGQTDSEFKKLDNKLLSQINELNQLTREINNGLNNTSPVFSTDLSRQHWKNSKTKQTPRDQYNYNLLKDGLHPGINLAKVWLKKLELQIKKDCWENWH